MHPVTWIAASSSSCWKQLRWPLPAWWAAPKQCWGSWWAAADHQQCPPAVSQQQGQPKGLLGCMNRQSDRPSLLLYSTLIRPHLEYWVYFWGLQIQKDMDKLEWTQWGATRVVKHFRGWRNLACSVWRRDGFEEPGSSDGEMTKALHTGGWWKDDRQRHELKQKSLRLVTRKAFSPWGQSGGEAGCPEKLFSRTQPWATWSDLKADLLWAGGWARNLWWYLPTWIILRSRRI